MKTFIVEMDENESCSLISKGMCGKRDWSKRATWDCEGDLNNRPAFCPLREVKELEVAIIKDIASYDTEKAWVKK